MRRVFSTPAAREPRSGQPAAPPPAQLSRSDLAIQQVDQHFAVETDGAGVTAHGPAQIGRRRELGIVSLLDRRDEQFGKARDAGDVAKLQIALTPRSGKHRAA